MNNQALSGLSVGELGGLESLVNYKSLFQSVTLDEYVQGRRKPDVIKVDVEGAELRVLKGAEELLSLPINDAPIWILEYAPHNYMKFGYSGYDLLNYLFERGYKVIVSKRQI